MGLQQSVEIRTLDLLCCRVVPPIILGMLMGFAMVNHEPSLPSTFPQENFVVWAMIVTYFWWFFFVWGIVYVGALYLLFLRPILRAVVNGTVSCRGTLPFEILLEVIFGIWVCGQITGTWVEGEDPSCFRMGTCKFSIIAQSIWDPTYFSSCEQSGPAYGIDACKNLLFMPRLLYTFIGTVGAFLTSSLLCDHKCFLIAFLLFSL